MRFSGNKDNIKIVTALILGLACIFQELCFIQIIGSRYLNGLDNQLASCNIEHWYLWLKGTNGFFTTSQFYPIMNNVGFLDMMMVFAPFYIAARIFFGHSVSYLISAVAVHLVGVAGIYFMLRKVFRCSFSSSMISVFLFSFSNCLQFQMGHVYLLSISLLPWIISFCIAFFRGIESDEIKFRYLVIAISLFALLCYSAIYVAQFLVLLVVLNIVFYGYICFKSKLEFDFLKTIIRSIKQHAAGYVICAVYSVLIMIPFVYAYFPILKENGGYKASDQLYYSPLLSDLLNVGTDNLLYGNAISELGMHQGEYTVGFPFLTFIFLLCVLIFTIKRTSYDKKDVIIVLCKSCAISICIIVLLVLKIDDQFNLWALLRCIVPGIASMRAMSRFILFLLFPLSFISGIFLNHIFSKIHHPSFRCILSILIALFFVLENVNKIGIQKLTWNNVVKDIDVAEMPADCESFFVFDSNITDNELEYSVEQNYIANNMAFRIANKYGVRTLNGIGSVFPYNTDVLFNVYADNYLKHITGWITKYHLTGIYGYDIETHLWKNVNEVLELISYEMNEGFSFQENDNTNIWYWAVEPTSKIHLFNLSEHIQNVNFSFETAAAPDGSADTLDIYIDDKFVKSVHEGNTVDLDLKIAANSGEIISILSHGSLCSTETDERTFAYMLKNPVLKAK